MDSFLSSPNILLLLAATLFLVGMLSGWFLRANVREKELNAEISDLSLDLQNTKTEYGTLKEDYNLQAADARKASLELENLRMHIQRYEHEQQINELATESAQAHAAQDKANVETLQLSLQTLEEQVLGLRVQNAELQKKIDFHKEEITAYANQKIEQTGDEPRFDSIQLYEEAIAQLEKERNTAIANADEMASQVATLRNELAKADSDLAILKVQSSRLETDLNRAKTEVQRLEAAQLEAMPSAAAENNPTMVDFTDEEVLDEVEIVEVHAKNAEQKPLDTNAKVVAAPIEDFEDDAQELAVEGGDILEEMDTFDSADAVLKNFVALKMPPAPPEKEVPTLSWSDNLQSINGIAGVYEERLNQMGIFTFKQLADTKDDAVLLEKMSKALRISVKRLETEDWAGQARRWMENESV